MTEPQNVPWGKLNFNRDLFGTGRGGEEKTRKTSSFLNNFLQYNQDHPFPPLPLPPSAHLPVFFLCD